MLRYGLTNTQAEPEAITKNLALWGGKSKIKDFNSQLMHYISGQKKGRFVCTPILTEVLKKTVGKINCWHGSSCICQPNMIQPINPPLLREGTFRPGTCTLTTGLESEKPRNTNRDTPPGQTGNAVWLTCCMMTTKEEFFKISLNCHKAEKKSTEACGESYMLPSFCDSPDAIMQPLLSGFLTAACTVLKNGDPSEC